MFRIARNALLSRKIWMSSIVLALLSMVFAFFTRPTLATNGREIWVLAQDTNQIKIVHGRSSTDTVALPDGTNPHLIEFSPSGAYAYIAGLGSGQVVIVRAADRHVSTLDINPSAGGTHHVQPSPDGRLLLVAQQKPTAALVKVVADEQKGTWEVAGNLALPSTPDCTTFRADGQRAYVSLASGLAVVDVAAMSILTVLPTEGKVACGFAPSKDGRTVYVTSNGKGGRLYRLDTTNDTLTDLGYTFDAYNLHVPALNANERVLYISDRGDRGNDARLDDVVYMVDLRCASAVCKAPKKIAVNPRADANDKPDGIVVQGQTAYVAMRATGQLAMITPYQPNFGLPIRLQTVGYLDLVPASSVALPHLAVRP